MKSDDLKLCYVDDHCAYFTTQALEDQWGDDWNDAPYEHNAGTPYRYDPEIDGKRGGKQPWKILRLYWEGSFETPESGYSNSPWSVEQINRGAIAWLRPSEWIPKSQSKWALMAGCGVREFVETIRGAGGEVSAPIGDLDEFLRRLSAKGSNSDLNPWRELCDFDADLHVEKPPRRERVVEIQHENGELFGYVTPDKVDLALAALKFYSKV